MEKERARSGSPDPLQARWTGTDDAPRVGAVVRAVLVATSEAATPAGRVERAAMRRDSRTMSRYEQIVSNMGYRREQRPIEDTPAAPRKPGR